MSERLSPLTVIYGPHKVAGQIKGQEVMSLFNERGLVDEVQMEEVYLEQIGHAPEVLAEGMIGPFDDLEAIQKFSFSLCQNFGNSGVSLVSLERYNEILSDCYKAEDLKAKLEAEGNFLRNPDASKGNFFNKIFN